MDGNAHEMPNRYWFDKDQKETPSYSPTILFDRKFENIYLKNPCVVCRERMMIKDISKVVEEMVENGWAHPGPSTIVCNKDECRDAFNSEK